MVMVTGAIVGGDDRRRLRRRLCSRRRRAGTTVLNDIVRFVDAGPAPPPAPRAAPPPQVNVAAPEPPAAPPPPPAASAAAVIPSKCAKIPEKRRPRRRSPGEGDRGEGVRGEREAKETEAKESEDRRRTRPSPRRCARRRRRRLRRRHRPSCHCRMLRRRRCQGGGDGFLGDRGFLGEKMTHDPVTAVFVRDIPQSADEASIEAAFAKIGPIAAVTIRTAKRQPDANAAPRRRRARTIRLRSIREGRAAQAAIAEATRRDGRQGAERGGEEGGWPQRLKPGRGQQPAKRREGSNKSPDATRGATTAGRVLLLGPVGTAESHAPAPGRETARRRPEAGGRSIGGSPRWQPAAAAGLIEDDFFSNEDGERARGGWFLEARLDDRKADAIGTAPRLRHVKPTA